MRKQGKAAGKSALRVGSSIARGQNPAAAVEREIQSKLDRAVHKLSLNGGGLSGRGAYGRGAYGRGAYGRGSYTNAAAPATNSLFADSKLQRSSFSSAGDETGRIVVSRREYVTRVVAPAVPGDFSNTSYSINPGLSGVFAWLSQIASNFEEYEFWGLVFSYQPVISTATTTGAMGSVVVACNYNAGAPKFKSFREMVEYQGAIESRICDPIEFGIECDPAKNAGHDMEYVRSGAVPNGEDIKSYDIGTFQFATSDVSAAYTAGTLLGHVYVEYKIRLGKPKLYSALGKNIMTDLISSGGSIHDNYPFGTAPVYSRENTIGGTMSLGGFQFYEFPSNFSGTVAVKLTAYSTISDDSPLSVTFDGNIETLNIVGTSRADAEEVANGTNSTYFALIRIGQQEGALPNKIRMTASFGTGTRHGATMLVTQVNPDVAWEDPTWLGY